MRKIYEKHDDAGHGWLKVPVIELAKLGIVNKISGYSYLNKGFAYLEEDCDLGVFVNARKEKGGAFALKTKYEEKDESPIREYAQYNLQNVAREIDVSVRVEAERKVKRLLKRLEEQGITLSKDSSYADLVELAKGKRG